MNQPVIGMLFLVAFNFVPVGYAACNGQQMSVDENAPLFAVLAHLYGGDGKTTFNLPNLPPVKDANGNSLTWIIATQGFMPVHQ